MYVGASLNCWITPLIYSVSEFWLTHHSADELIVNGLLHKQTAGSDAVLTFVEVHRAHSL